jgi:hypothetical protein
MLRQLLLWALVLFPVGIRADFFHECGLELNTNLADPASYFFRLQLFRPTTTVQKA